MILFQLLNSIFVIRRLIIEFKNRLFIIIYTIFIIIIFYLCLKYGLETHFEQKLQKSISDSNSYINRYFPLLGKININKEELKNEDNKYDKRTIYILNQINIINNEINNKNYSKAIDIINNLMIENKDNNEIYKFLNIKKSLVGISYYDKIDDYNLFLSMECTDKAMINQFLKCYKDVYK